MNATDTKQSDELHDISEVLDSLIETGDSSESTEKLFTELESYE